MKRQLLLSLAAMAAMAASAAGNAFVENSTVYSWAGVSSDGMTVFGHPGTSGDDLLTTYLYDIDAREAQMFTIFDETAPEDGGRVMAANGMGMLVGTMRDPEWVAPKVNDGTDGATYIENQMLFTAMLWIDGEPVKLDHNKYADPADFVSADGTAVPKLSDGFTAAAISDDGSVINGYVTFLGCLYPVRWDRQPDGTYTSVMFDRPSSSTRYYRLAGVSADGSTVVWNDKSTGGNSWVYANGSTSKPVKFEPAYAEAELTEVCITALSPSGDIALFECYVDGKYAYGAYTFSTGEIRWLPMPDNSKGYRWLSTANISDEGTGFITDSTPTLYYFDIEKGACLTIPDYLRLFSSTIEGSASLTAACVSGVSRDSRTVVGNSITRGGVLGKGFIMRLPDESPAIYQLHGLEAFSSSTSSLRVKWQPLALREGASVKHYLLTVDGKAYTIADPATGADGKHLYDIENTALGSHTVSLRAVVTDATGKEMNTLANTVAVNDATNTALFFFENMDDADVVNSVNFVYNHDTFTNKPTTDGQTIGFYLDAADFSNNNPFWCSGSISRAPWDTYLESRWLDATGQADGFYLTYQSKALKLNYYDYSDSNLFQVEASLDGETWQVLDQSDALANGGYWTSHMVDLAPYAGKAFKIRFHLSGAGTHDTEWGIDYIGILSNADMIEAPADVLELANNKRGVKLGWKNNYGAYEVSHCYNSPVTYSANIGNYDPDTNESWPLQVACDFPSTMMAPYAGKYITSVATMVYEPGVEAWDEHVTLEAIVYDENLNELSRGTFSPDGPWYDQLDEDQPTPPNQVIWLDTPVQIEKGKKYRVATRVSNCPVGVSPIWYFSASDDYLPGVTDLYLEEQVGEWRTIFDLYANESDDDFKLYGRCIFNIRPCVTDEPNPERQEFDQMLWFYQLYRNGEQLDLPVAYFTQPTALDPQPLEGEAAYSVRAFRRDGRVSPLSAPAYISTAGLDNLLADDTSVGFNVDQDARTISFNGEFASATLYTLGGMAVRSVASGSLSARGLDSGVYVLVIDLGNGSRAAHKVALR